MSRETVSESDASSPTSSIHSESQSQSATHKQSTNTKKKTGKVTKPRLSASQKNTNHKDAENKRRNAIRERFTDLSKMVPGAGGQERSEQVMLGKTTDFLRDALKEQRELEAIAMQRGILLDEKDRLKDTDYGGPNWREPNMDSYRSSKAKKEGPNSHSRTGSDG